MVDLSKLTQKFKKNSKFKVRTLNVVKGNIMCVIVK